ncbi:MAG: tRNA (cytidine(56)-2'-O)-methyltransferase [Nitrososphaerales archaeon]
MSVLRLGHRLVRDARMSTHIGLVARAFGAKSLIISGVDDETVDSLKRVSNRWGGNFDVKFQKNWREKIRSFDGTVVHLTMYGEQLDEALPKIRNESKILLVVGAEKVPGDIYKLADYNVAVGSQPHSEIAALAVFLDRLFMGGELHNMFENARFRIIPERKGKGVENLKVEN